MINLAVLNISWCRTSVVQLTVCLDYFQICLLPAQTRQHVTCPPLFSAVNQSATLNKTSLKIKENAVGSIWCIVWPCYKHASSNSHFLRNWLQGMMWLANAADMRAENVCLPFNYLFHNILYQLIILDWSQESSTILDAISCFFCFLTKYLFSALNTSQHSRIQK